MKITDTKVHICDGGFRPWTFIRVETDEPGLIGWGECSDWRFPSAVKAAVEEFSNVLVGKNPFEINRITNELIEMSIRHFGGISYKAIAGIDIALHDIKAKALGVPVYELLGGKVRDRIPLYWSHCGLERIINSDRLGLKKIKTLDDLADLCDEVRKVGFRYIKTNLLPLEEFGQMGQDVYAKFFYPHNGECTPEVEEVARKVIGTFRENLGRDVGIALDTAFTFKLGGAIRLARALEPYELLWMEVESWDPQALRSIRDSTRTPICTGESLYGPEQFREYLNVYAQDYVMPDIGWNGITIGRKVAELAQLHDVLFTPHNCTGPICTLASAHLCATVRNLFGMEFDYDDAPWRDEIITRPIADFFNEGDLVLGDQPGLGADVIEEKLSSYPPREGYVGAK